MPRKSPSTMLAHSAGSVGSTNGDGGRSGARRRQDSGEASSGRREAARSAVERLASFLSDRRKSSGLSQADVARELGYTTAQFISNWERAQSAPPMAALPVLAQLYRFKPEQLVQLLIDAAKEQVEASLQSQFQTLQQPTRRSR